jgi:DNA-binding CsgD family transcriptional regulator
LTDHLRLEHTERQIADITDRSLNTVHVHVKNIYRKLNVSRRKQLVELFADQ